MAKVKWKAKTMNRPRKLTKAMMVKYFKPVVMKSRDDAYKNYRFITDRWTRKSRPKYERKTGTGVLGSEGWSVYSSVGIGDNRTPLFWLDGGTRVRYRTMSRDWKSKTWPYMGIRTQNIGRGRAAGWGYHPGIEPRNFRESNIINIRPDFLIGTRRAFHQMCKDLFT